jgi:hypothetical protein
MVVSCTVKFLYPIPPPCFFIVLHLSTALPRNWRTQLSRTDLQERWYKCLASFTRSSYRLFPIATLNSECLQIKDADHKHEALILRIEPTCPQNLLPPSVLVAARRTPELPYKTRDIWNQSQIGFHRFPPGQSGPLLLERIGAPFGPNDGLLY